MLSGDDSQQSREDAIDRLVSDTRTDRLDYIFTVDIFNEGVDVPEINQVILLRPTESPIIFVQQLGRGLRKAEGKEFVIVLDFIGNYQTNYMIPIALSGDRSGNKDNIRRSLMEGNNIIKGASTIYFDEISRDRIYKSIDAADLEKYLPRHLTKGISWASVVGRPVQPSRGLQLYHRYLGSRSFPIFLENWQQHS